LHASTILTRIAEIITPYVGTMMARSSIEMYCKRLGIAGDVMDRNQLDQLLRQLSLGLNIFIGRDKTETVIQEIRGGMEIYR
jgi:hypothetical protein